MKYLPVKQNFVGSNAAVIDTQVQTIIKSSRKFL